MIRFLCLIDTDDRQYFFKSALARLAQESDGALSGCCFSPMEIRLNPLLHEALLQAVESADFAIIYFHGGCQNLANFDLFWERVSSRMPSFFISSLPEEIAELMPQSRITADQYRQLHDYFCHSTAENTYNLLLKIANDFFNTGRRADPCRKVPSFGIYLNGAILDAEAEAEYLNEAARTEHPVVGVLMHGNQATSGNTQAIDSLLDTLQEEALFPLAVFSALSGDEQLSRWQRLDYYFRDQPKIKLRCILVTTGFSVTFSGDASELNEAFSSSIFERWQVPVLQVMPTRYSVEQYDEKPQGMDPMSLSVHVFQPEMDGQIINVPYAAVRVQEATGASRRVFVPMADRVRQIVRLVKNFVKLSTKKNSEKKIAILFHNMPGNHNIGRGAGLDTFASVQAVLDALVADGYLLAQPFRNGQEIARRLLKALTNDVGWIPAEEAVRRAADRIGPALLEAWFSSLKPQIKDQLTANWGQAPGEVLVEADQMLIPGLINGHIFIGLQPSRAFDQQAEKIYHHAVFPPPYSYIAYYRWLEDVFQADAVIHVGTHGSLEWLPGKEVGLSQNCYPEICLGTVPNFYIYHMGITGEGIQAKRRSAAVVLDHLPPSMDDAGVYDQLLDLDATLKEYAAARQMQPSQVPVLQTRILTLAQAANLLQDQCLTVEDFRQQPERAIEQLHLWLEELKNSVVTDGLHVFGHVPEGDKYQNLMRMLVRVKNGTVPSLLEAILMAQGYDAKRLREDPTQMVSGVLASSLLEKAVATGKELVAQLSASDYQLEAVDTLLRQLSLTGDPAPLRTVLRFLCQEVKPRLDRTSDELRNLIHGLKGGFVEPGLGGNPTRGNVRLLPTGRNFFAGDPAEIPSVAAWEIGQQLAQKSLEHHLAETGCYPESVAMVIWSGNVLKTCGEDFGEIFAFMGVEPVYLGDTSKVIGVRAIPLEILGRPRIDVTLRISGLFRDMYPNLIELMDQAVSCAAAQDESESDNYIRKHLNEDMLSLMSEGLPVKDALDQASIRVFGCPAGGYGAGVANLIGNRNWTDYRDIATVYETWSGHAYGRQHHGTALPGLFKRRLSTVSMTIKNESTVETDMLSSDDFFSYHGGLIACVKANSGNVPLALTGHSDDPERPYVRDAARETARIMRSRILNPKWLSGLRAHGYKGAQEISKAMDSFFGWDASASVAEDWMYEQMAQRFLFDQETRDWIRSVNSGVLYNLSGKLLEAHQRGMWQTDGATHDALQHIFLELEGLLEAGTDD